MTGGRRAYDARHTAPRGRLGNVRAMATPADTSSPDEPVPLGQRLFDNMFLLLAAGMFIMLLLYTGWGLWEILSLPPATLP